jgi:PIN domain nuclease of toxin-antitoxin system
LPAGDIHSDPFERALIAQAITVTADETMAKYASSRLRVIA